MTTFTDLLTSLKDELTARYKSPFWGAALIALILFHWKIVVFLLTERRAASDTIAFVEANAGAASIAAALAFAAAYVVLFPWIELTLSRLASHGVRSRNDFQIREREREIGRRRVIAQQEAQLIELELKIKEDQSKASDIQLARDYQSILSGDHFPRWLKDVQNGAINSSLNNTIMNYLHKVDTVEGKFINPDVEKAHGRFVEAVSTLNSSLNDGRSPSDTTKHDELVRFAEAAHQAHQTYRSEARRALGI